MGNRIDKVFYDDMSDVTHAYKNWDSVVLIEKVEETDEEDDENDDDEL